MKNNEEKWSFLLSVRHCSVLCTSRLLSLQEKEENTLLRAPWCAGLLASLPCGLAGPAGLLALLASGPCWGAGHAGALGLLAFWPTGLLFLFFFFFFSFAGCLLPAFFLFLFSTIFLFLLIVQIFICTLKHNIKFRLNKINIMHIK
jgi:hypothetical protein